MGWSALINSYAEGYKAKKLSAAEDRRQEDMQDFLIEQQNRLFELFEGPNIAQGLLEEIVGRGGEDAILEWLFMPPVKMTRAEKRELGLFEEAEPMAMESVQRLLGLREPLDSLINTGFRTDIAPIVAAEQRRLMNETAPALAERFGSSLSGSGFQQAIGQAGEDMGIYLGEKQAGLDEAAAGRRIQGLEMAPGTIAAPLNLQTGFAEALGAAGERFRKRKEETRAANIGAKLLSALGMLSGVEQGQGFMMQGFPGQAGGLGSAALGAGLPGLLSGAGNLLNSLTGSLWNMGRDAYNSQFNIGGTGVSSSEFDSIFGNGGTYSTSGGQVPIETSQNQNTLSGGFAYV